MNVGTFLFTNAANIPLNAKSGTVPDVSGAMRDLYQRLTIYKLSKTVVGFQEQEIQTAFAFSGMIQPLTERQLQLKTEGQRAWTWLWMHADVSLQLEVDEVVIFNGLQTRVMSRKDYTLYGYAEYHLVQDFTGAGPYPATTATFDGGNAFTEATDSKTDGGNAMTTGPGSIDGGNSNAD